MQVTTSKQRPCNCVNHDQMFFSVFSRTNLLYLKLRFYVVDDGQITITLNDSTSLAFWIDTFIKYPTTSRSIRGLARRKNRPSGVSFNVFNSHPFSSFVTQCTALASCLTLSDDKNKMNFELAASKLICLSRWRM